MFSSAMGRLVGGIVCSLMLAACGLPRGAGIEREVLWASDDATSGFAVYEITSALLPSVSQWPVPNEARLDWIAASQGANTRIVAPGDSVSLLIWDSSDNSLLLPEGQRQVALEGMRVEADGTVFVPYVGDVRISGLTPLDARKRLQSSLSSISSTVQVQFSLEEGRGNSVDLVGGVGSPGSYPLPNRNYSVLSLISSAGGVATGLENPQIRLIRGDQIFGTSINRLYEEPQLDTRLRPGDQVIVEEDDRFFLSVGAAGIEAQHPFTRDVVSAMDAVSIIGGISDTRGNPQGILILRQYPPSALAAGDRGPRDQRVVFALDLTKADGVFSASNFRIAPRDVIYIAESPVSSLQTILGLSGNVFGTFLLTNNL